MKILLLLCSLSLSLLASERIVFTKKFPGSVPAYVSIAVGRDGAVAYKESPDDDPETFQLEPDVTTVMFQLAGKLDHFKGKLESGLKVANTGEKTLRWENGSDTSEAKFNYSLDTNAQLLADWFERITESETLAVQLRRSLRYDRLGVNDAVLKIQSSWDRKRLVGVSQILPMLDKVAGNEALLHMARERAAALAETLRASTKESLKPEASKSESTKAETP